MIFSRCFHDFRNSARQETDFHLVEKVFEEMMPWARMQKRLLVREFHSSTFVIDPNEKVFIYELEHQFDENKNKRDASIPLKI